MQATPIAPYLAKFHGSSSDASTITLRLDFVNGCTLFDLLRSELLTTTDIGFMIEAMDAVHCCPGIPVTIEPRAVFDNYVTKLRARIGDKARY